MIKILIQIIFILYMVPSVSAQLDPVDDWNLSGKVKSVTENSYTGLATGKEYIKGPKGWSYSWKSDSRIELDSNGNIIRRTYFDNLAKLIRTDEFTFEKGKLTRSKILTQTNTFEYDSLGRIKNELYMKGDINLRIIYMHDSKNRVQQKLQFNLGNELKTTDNFTYDERNNLILQESIYPGGKDSVVYTYNAKNQLTKTVWFDETRKIVERTVYEYIEGKVSYQKWEDFEEGKPDGTVEYLYEKGNEKSVVDIDADGTIAGKETHSYSYDKQGNWIRKVTIIDDEEIFIIERKIEYY